MLEIHRTNVATRRACPAIEPCSPEDDHFRRDICAMLASAGLRPTKQRLLLASLLFAQGKRHVTADMVFEEAIRAGMSLSLATVYNTLNRLLEAGLLSQVSVDGTKTYFDTNPSPHYHFYFEDTHELTDIPSNAIASNVPQPLEGYQITGVGLVVRLRRKP